MIDENEDNNSSSNESESDNSSPQRVEIPLRDTNTDIDKTSKQ